MTAGLPQHDALAATRESEAPFRLECGRVLRKLAKGRIVVLLDGDERTMPRAASCLLSPEAGDRVLVAGNGPEAYVLAVLERPGPAPAVLTADTPSKAMVLAASQLALRAEEEAEIHAPRMNIKGGRFTIAAETLSFVAKLLTQTLERWQTSAQKVDLVANDIATKAARRVTIVDETDTLEAGVVLQKVEATIVTTARAVVIAATEDLRLDGTRVTVG
jgi:Protein of unknown function (DUF3540)